MTYRLRGKKTCQHIIHRNNDLKNRNCLEQRNMFPQFPSISFQKFLMKSRFHGLQFLARAVKWKAWPSTACRDWMCCVRLVQIGGRNSFPLQRYVYLHEWVLFMANQINTYHTWIAGFVYFIDCDLEKWTLPMLLSCHFRHGYGKILGCEHQTPDSPTSHTNVVGTSLDLSSCRILLFFPVPSFWFLVLVDLWVSAKKKKTSRICQFSQPKNWH